MVSSQAVLSFLQTIPKGKVTTYKALAEQFNTHPRAIASIMRGNKEPEVYPCYKVVAADGSISGYSGENGVEGKIKRLKKDGVHFEGEKIHPSSIQI